MSFFSSFEARLSVVKVTLRDVARQNKAQFVHGSLCMMLTKSFLVFCVPSFMSCGHLLLKVGIGAHRGPAAGQADGPMGRSRDPIRSYRGCWYVFLFTRVTRAASWELGKG